MNKRLVVCSLACLWMLSGCSTFGPKFEAPHLDVVGVQMLESDIFSQRLELTMRVQNPNNRSLPVRGITCDLEVAGQKFARGVSSSDFTVPALGETEFKMLLTANMAGALVRMLGSNKNMDSVEYKMTGKVNLASGLIRSIPFSESGTLPLK